MTLDSREEAPRSGGAEEMNIVMIIIFIRRDKWLGADHRAEPGRRRRVAGAVR